MIFKQTFLTKWFMESGYQDLETYKALTKCFEQEHRGALPHANFMRPFCQRIPHASSHVPDDPNMLMSPPLLARSSSGLSERSINMGLPGGDGKVVLFVRHPRQVLALTAWFTHSRTTTCRCHICTTRQTTADKR